MNMTIIHVFVGTLGFGGGLSCLMSAIVILEYKYPSQLMILSLLSGFLFYLAAVQFAYFYKELSK